MKHRPINLRRKFGLFSDQWSPKIIAQLNDYHFKLARVEGEILVVPKGVEHKPFAEKEAKILLVEPAGTVNTGDAGGDRTAEDDIWI